MDDNLSAKLSNVSAAIRVMTAWDDNGDDTKFMAEQVISLLSEEAVDIQAATVDLLLGMTNLCGVLLIRREAEMGATPAETLQEVAALAAGGTAR